MNENRINFDKDKAANYVSNVPVSLLKNSIKELLDTRNEVVELKADQDKHYRFSTIGVRMYGNSQSVILNLESLDDRIKNLEYSTIDIYWNSNDKSVYFYEHDSDVLLFTVPTMY